MSVASCFTILLSLGFAAAPAPKASAQDGDLSELVERALTTRTPDLLTAASRRVEEAVAADPKDRKPMEWLVRLLDQAAVKPLLAEALEKAKTFSPPLEFAVQDPGKFSLLHEFPLAGNTVRCYREESHDELYFVVFSASRYECFLRTEAGMLVAKIGGFGPLRSLGPVEAGDPKEAQKAVEKLEPDLRLVTEIERATQAAANSTQEGTSLTEAAGRLTAEIQKNGERPGLTEELAHLYDRLGEFVIGTAREPQYRRLQLLAALHLSEISPKAQTTHRTLALAYFRLGAYPIAALEASLAPHEPLAQDLLQVLAAWSQAEHEKLESFEVDQGAFLVDQYRAKASAPESGGLFAELTFIVRRPKRAEFAVYTLSSQQLKTQRHYYIYFNYLGQRTLLTTYSEHRPQDGAVKDKVAILIRRLSEAPGTTK